jgi:hypothetical protein
LLNLLELYLTRVQNLLLSVGATIGDAENFFITQILVGSGLQQMLSLFYDGKHKPEEGWLKQAL